MNVLHKKWVVIGGGILFLWVVFGLLGGDDGAYQNQQTKIADLSAKVDTLQKQLEAEKQKSDQSEATESAAPEKQEEVPQVVLEGEIVKVTHVVDGDTIKLENGKVVRYIGIDTPETVDPRKPVQCFGKEASDKNRELVEGKKVRLVKDISETDKYKRILRYVYIGDVFVNDYLVRNGYAHASSYSPDVKHQDQFRVAEQEARENKKGLWANGACETEAPAIVPKTTTPSSNSAGSYVCNCSKTCSQMSSCAEAQYQLNACGCSARDADDDGIACDADCQ